MVAVLVARTPPTLSPHAEAIRAGLNRCALVLIIAGFLCLISFWSSYYFGFFLSVGSILTGYTQLSHTRDANALVNNHTVVNANGAFKTLQYMNIAGVLLALGSIISSAWALYVYTNSVLYWYTPTVLIIFDVCALLASIVILFCAIFGAMKTPMMHTELLPHFLANAAGTALAAGTTAVMMAPPVAPLSQPLMAGTNQNYSNQPVMLVPPGGQPMAAQPSPYGSSQYEAPQVGQPVYAQPAPPKGSDL